MLIASTSVAVPVGVKVSVGVAVAGVPVGVSVGSTVGVEVDVDVGVLVAVGVTVIVDVAWMVFAVTSGVDWDGFTGATGKTAEQAVRIPPIISSVPNGMIRFMLTLVG